MQAPWPARGFGKAGSDVHGRDSYAGMGAGQKTKTMASCPITSWQIDREKKETVTDFIFLGSRISEDGDSAMKSSDTCSLEEKLWQTYTAY